MIEVGLKAVQIEKKFRELQPWMSESEILQIKKDFRKLINLSKF